MTGTEIYKRTPAYEGEARKIRLHAPHWKLLLAFDGQRSLAEVALSAEVSFAEALPPTRKFLDQGWIEEQPITLDQYLKRMGARDISAVGAAVPPATVLHEPRTDAPAPPPLPASPATAKPVESSAAPEKAPAAKSSRRPMRLSAVVDYITSLVGNIARAHPFQILIEGDRLFRDPSLVEKFLGQRQRFGEGDLRAQGDFGKAALAVEDEEKFPLRRVEADLAGLAFVGWRAFIDFRAGHCR